MSIYFMIYFSIVYNGGSLPKLANSAEPPRILTNIINRPEKGLPYYFGDSSLIAISGPRCCLPGQSYSQLAENVKMIPEADFQFDVVVVDVVDYQLALRRGLDEEVLRPLQDNLGKALSARYPNSKVFIIPPSRIRSAASVYSINGDGWHPSGEGFRLLQKEYPEAFPEEVFYSTSSRKVRALLRPVVGLFFALKEQVSSFM